MTEFSTHTITLDGKHKQLIDLNKDKKLFEAHFVITPHTLDLDKKYKLAVVSQSVLDGEDEIQFRDIVGIYRGDVKNDDPESKYENFFIVLQSLSQMKPVQIEVELQEILEQNQEVQTQQETHELETYHQEVHEKAKSEKSLKNKSVIKYVILFFVLVAGGYLLYYFWKKSKAQPEVKSYLTAEPVQKPTHTFLKDQNMFSTEKVFNPFKNRKTRSPSITSPGSVRSVDSKSSSNDSFVFEE